MQINSQFSSSTEKVFLGNLKMSGELLSGALIILFIKKFYTEYVFNEPSDLAIKSQRKEKQCKRKMTLN